MNPNLISLYLKSKANAWAASTLKSEASRLKSLSPALDGNPQTLWNHMTALKPHSRLTAWERVVCFYDWQVSEGIIVAHLYKKFRLENAQLFKNAYIRERITISYETAQEKIEGISDPAIRRRALEILGGALRWCESTQPKGRGYVQGKGGKLRPDFRPDIKGPDYTLGYKWFWKKLKDETGLKPHTLRKLALTRAAERGAREADLMALAGWSSIATASSYLQPRKDAELKQLVALDAIKRG